MDWASLGEDAEALNFIDNISCHRLNMALRGIGIDSFAKDAAQDGLKLIKLKNVKDKSEMMIRFKEGVLEMHCAYSPRTDGMFGNNEIQKVIANGLIDYVRKRAVCAPAKQPPLVSMEASRVCQATAIQKLAIKKSDSGSSA